MKMPSAGLVQSTLLLPPAKRSAVYWLNAAIAYEQRGDMLCAACAWAAAHYVMPDEPPFAESSLRCLAQHHKEIFA